MSKFYFSTTKELLDLQLFADGTASGAMSGAGAGDGDTGTLGSAAEDGLATQEKKSLADVKYGKQEQTPAAESKSTDDGTKPEANLPEDRKAEFERLRRGELKEEFDRWAKDTVQKRLKGTQETVDKYNSLAPVLDLLAKKHGVDASDVTALAKAIEEDDSYFEAESFEKGIPVEQLKAIRKMERENAVLKQKEAQREAREEAERIYSKWAEQEKAAKAYFPGLDLREELKNPEFADLLRSNVDVLAAYKVVHMDEIIPAAMKHTADEMAGQYAKSVASNSKRPQENGTASKSSVLAKSDVSQLSGADFEEIYRRVLRGEKVSFG